MSKHRKAVTKEETILYDRITRTETKILQKISQIKNQKPNYCCKHFENLKDNCDFYDPNTNYYEKYWKLFLLNELCCAKLQESNSVLSRLEQKVADVQVKLEIQRRYLKSINNQLKEKQLKRIGDLPMKQRKITNVLTQIVLGNMQPIFL